MSSKYFCGVPHCELTSFCSVISPLFKGPLNNDNLITQLHIPSTQGRPVNTLCFSLASVIPNRDNCKETYCSQLYRLEVQCQSAGIWQKCSRCHSIWKVSCREGSHESLRVVSNWPAAKNTEESPLPFNKPQLKTMAMKFPHELKRLTWGYGCRYLVVMHLARTILTWSSSCLVRSRCSLPSLRLLSSATQHFVSHCNG